MRCVRKLEDAVKIIIYRVQMYPNLAHTALCSSNCSVPPSLLITAHNFQQMALKLKLTVANYRAYALACKRIKIATRTAKLKWVEV